MGLIAMKCPSCSANIELDDSREFGFCIYCGTKVMMEKVIIEHRGGVVLDNSKKLNNLHILAERALDSGDNSKARDYFNEILVENPNDWKSVFYSVFLEKDKFTPMDEGYGIFSNRVIRALESSFDLIGELPENEQKVCYSVIAEDINNYATTVLNYAVNSEEKAVAGLRNLCSSDIDILTNQVAEGYLFASMIPSNCAIKIHNSFLNEEKELVTKLFFTGLRLLNCSSRWYDMGGHEDEAFSTMVTILDFLESTNPEAAEEIVKELPISYE